MNGILPPGTRLRGGQYTLKHVLGQGGFGITYIAFDSGLGVDVALKELFPSEVSSRGQDHTVIIPSTMRDEFKSFKDDFRREAQILLSLRHRAVVRVLSVFEEHETIYLVMELLTGETLGSKLTRERALSENETKTLLDAVLGALEEIHQKGMLHRDIKPDNIMLTHEGPILIDFGTAMKMAGSHLASPPTLTPAYAPLEQYLKQGAFGPPTDLYALAATAYHALTGIQPPSSLDRAKGVPLAPISGLAPSVSPSLEKALTQCLQLKIVDRPQSAAALRSLVFPAQPPQTQNPIPTPTPQPQTPPKKAPNGSGILAVVVIGFVAIGFLGWNTLKPTQQASSTAPVTQPTTPKPKTPKPTPVLSLDPIETLIPQRARVLEMYAKNEYAQTIALADEWLNAHPTDALVAIYRNNALQKQLKRKTWTLGISVPTSGANAQSGEAVLQGVYLAIFEANRSTAKNPYVIAEVLNDRYDRAQAIRVATAFFDDPEVVGVVGPIGSSAALASAEVYAGGLPNMLPTAVDDRLGQSGDFTFRLSPSNRFQGKALAQLILSKNKRKVGVFRDVKDAYSKSLSDSFSAEAQRQGMKVTWFEFSAGTPLAKTMVSSNWDLILDQDAFLIAGSYPDVASIAKTIRSNPLMHPLFAGSAAYSQELLKQGGSAVEGLLMTAQFHATLQNPEVKNFVGRFAKIYGGGVPNARAAQAYLAAASLIEATSRVPTTSVDRRKDIAQILHGKDPKQTPFKMKGILAPVTFDSSGGILAQPFVVIEVQQGTLRAQESIYP